MPIETPEEISSRSAAEQFRKREIFLFRFGVPERGFHGGFGHVVAADLAEQIGDVRRGIEFLALQDRPQKITDDVPRSFDGFVENRTDLLRRWIRPNQRCRPRRLQRGGCGGAWWCRSWFERARPAACGFRAE